MAQEQEPAKKIAKRVIKKTVVRRPAPSQPPLRYGRPAAPESPGESTDQRQPAAKASAPRKVQSPRPPAAPRPTRQLGKKAGATTGKVAGAVGGALTGAGHSVGDRVSAAFAGIRSIRYPRLEQIWAAAIVGAFIGLITVAITALLTRMFTELRGVSTGGGKWGSLTVVVVAFIAFALGEYLLAKMHVRQPRITSFLGLVMTLILILAFFLNPISTAWAILIMPVCGAVTFALAHKLIAITDSAAREA